MNFGFYFGVNSRAAGGESFVCLFGGETLPDSDGFDDSCAGAGFYYDLDCRTVDFCTGCFIADKGNESNFAELAEPLVGKRAWSTQIPLVNKCGDWCDRVYRWR